MAEMQAHLAAAPPMLDVRELERMVQHAQQHMKDIDSAAIADQAANMTAQVESQMAMAFAQAAPMPPAPPAPPSAHDQERRARDAARDAERRARDDERRARHDERRSHDDSDYATGKHALESHDYAKAVDVFTRVAADKGPHADGALYWLAFAQTRQGKRAQATQALTELRQQYPQSRWLEDARALEVETRTQSGQPISREAASDEDLKLLALNSLIGTDPQRVVPVIDKILKSNNTPALKERALFVLAQSRSPQAREVLTRIAKGGANPDLQLKAVEYLGVMNKDENRPILNEVYRTTQDPQIKRAVLRSYMISRDTADLLNTARSESNPQLRLEAIRYLAITGAAQDVYNIARTEKDPHVRLEEIRMLGITSRDKSGELLASLYKQETDPAAKREVLNALMIQQNAPAIVDIAKHETNPELKRDAVQKLTMVHSKEGTDYLMELLNK